MDGSWQNQGDGISTSGWLPMYMMGGQMGYGQQPPQAPQAPQSFGSAPPPLGMSPPGQGGPQPNPQGQMQGPGQMPGQTQQGFNMPSMPSMQGQGGIAQMMPQGYGKPLSLSNFTQPQGRQIMGNPTSSYVGQSFAPPTDPGQYD